MLTPEGLPANKMDRIMLLASWSKFLSSKKNVQEPITEPIIQAGMGKPTYPLHPYTGKFLAEYWAKHTGEAINYGEPAGDLDARTLMAEAMSKWYGLTIHPSTILFTVGGAGGLRSIFTSLANCYKDVPNFRVITPYPFYSLYKDNELRLHPIPVMDLKAYKFSAESLYEGIRSAYDLAKKDKGYPRALLLCDPNNPLGTTLGERELKRIADVLRIYPQLTIVLDEAYAEMVLDGTQHVSLLKVAPDLQKRIILMRSATKGLSAAGERMAIIIAFNEYIRNDILQHSIRNYGHAPRSLQIAYAETMYHFNETDRIKINDFYREKIEYVKKRLEDMGASMPDKDYQVSATFYILGHFGELLGEPLSVRTKAALDKCGFIESDEDIAYSLLFDDSIMVAPGSYFGMNKNAGYMRITCSAPINELSVLMDRLESRLNHARLMQQQQFRQEICQRLMDLIKIAYIESKKGYAQLRQIMEVKPVNTLHLKKQNKELKELLLLVKRYINQTTEIGKNRAAIIIQSAYRAHLAKKSRKEINWEQDKEWEGFVDRVSPEASTVRTYLQKLSVAERLELTPWKEHLQKQEHHFSANFLIDWLCSPTVSKHAPLLMTVVLALSTLGVGLLLSTGAIGLTATSAAGGSIALMGIGFFSSSTIETQKEPELKLGCVL